MVDYAAVEAAVEKTITTGQAGWSTINAVLVSADGETKFARYRNGSGPDDALHVWSITKSVVSALIGIAIDERLIDSLDQTLADLLPRYAGDMDTEQRAITLRQLMTMSGGYIGDQPVHNIHVVFQSRRDPVPMILRDGPETKPGAVFDYSSRSSHLVSAVLREALMRADGDKPRTVLDYARQKLFEPLEINTSGARERRVLLGDPAYDTVTRFDWGTDAAGLHTACCLLRLRPVDLVKLGELYLGDGVWRGRRILPAGWVTQTMTAGPVSPQYGLMWWLDIDPHGHPTWLARGSEGQLIGIVPEHRLVVAVGSVPTEDYSIPGSNVGFILDQVVTEAFG